LTENYVITNVWIVQPSTTPIIVQKRITEDGNLRITSTGDIREIEGDDINNWTDIPRAGPN